MRYKGMMQAVILAGGKGTRLAPYTTSFPKPLVPIGDMPILELVVRQLVAAGVERITLAVGHLAELIRAYFSTHELGELIEYSHEATPLGTVGPLAQIEKLDTPFLVMNGDVLTTLDYRALVAYHEAHGGWLTIASYERRVDIDFGILQVNGGHTVVDYFEKPTHTYRVSMGVYVFDPRVLGYIPRGQRLDLPDLVKALLADGRRVVAYPFDGVWLDIGRPDDYARANDVFVQMRDVLVPKR
jgi:NDP-sugar pyrophosphorylase family protein